MASSSIRKIYHPSGSRDGSDDGGSFENKQIHPRVKTDIEIPYWKYVKCETSDQILVGFVKNMSKGGFFIETENIYEPSSIIAFEFFLPRFAKLRNPNLPLVNSPFISGQRLLRIHSH